MILRLVRTENMIRLFRLRKLNLKLCLVGQVDNRSEIGILDLISQTSSISEYDKMNLPITSQIKQRQFQPNDVYKHRQSLMVDIISFGLSNNIYETSLT